MRGMLNRAYLHFVWATWDRLPLLTPERRERVYAAIKAKCDELGCTVYAIGGIEDHVHLIVQLSPTLPFFKLIKDAKGASSHLATHELDRDAFFKWQGGYAVFAVCPENLERAIRYVRNQEQHHREGNIIPEWEAPENEE
jgi:putative transposase